MKTKSRTWYLFKKSFFVFPGGGGAGGPDILAADALTGFYRRARDRAGPLRRLGFRAWGLGFPLFARLRAAQARRKHDLPADWTRRAAVIARRRFVDPEELAIHRIEDEAALATHIRRFEEAAINKAINPLYWRPGCVLHDKIAFADLCAAGGVAHPKTYATCVGGRIDVRAAPPPGPLFVKPSEGAGGVGAMLVEVPAGCDPGRLAGILRGAAGLRPDWLAQAALVNHPEMTDIAMNALSTFRVITILDETGRAETVATAIKVATREEAITDNGAAGGLFFGVDPDTEIAGLGARLIGAVWHERNPGNGVMIRGRKIPFTREARRMACDVHERLFPDYVYVGWDIALTPDGPVMIEGNAKASMAVAQRPILRDMAPARFAALLGHHLDRLA